jgi:hypothetical protein
MLLSKPAEPSFSLHLTLRCLCMIPSLCAAISGIKVSKRALAMA